MIGQLAALIAAFLWATSSFIYSFVGQKIPPLQLNFLKGIIAILLILLTFGLQRTGISLGEPIPVLLLALSGIIGIGLGDTAFFLALNTLGVRKTLLLETAAPPMSACLGFVLIGEIISLQLWLGICLTLMGVIWVIWERSERDLVLGYRSGLIWVMLAAIAQSLGAVLSRIALINSEITPLESSLIRLLAGSAIALCLSLIPLFAAEQSLTATLKGLPSRTILIIFLASFGGTYLGIWLQQISFKYTSIGIAQTLLATSPLFSLLIAWLRKEEITTQSFLGVILASIGVGFLLIGQN